MKIIPAVDLKGGRCVRLTRGEQDRETVYSGDPVAVARTWVGLGARRLHVIDLDGAFSGQPQHCELIEAIAREVSVPLQVGGGLRELESISRLLSLGVTQVILGTRAVTDGDFLARALDRYPGSILVSIDARNGVVAVEGWTRSDGRPAAGVARELKAAGLERVIVTDVGRDGTLAGPNIALMEAILDSGLEVVAAGGISSLGDLERLSGLEPRGLVGAVVGKAVYTGDVDLQAALSRFGGG